MFIISTYVDNERWISAFEPLLYPAGVTFYRPFSYREEYFHPVGLATELASPESAQKLLADGDWNTGWFGIRFSKQSDTEFQKTFVPLRRATLLSVERLDGINLTFTLGDYIIPVASSSGGRPELPTLELTGIVGDVAATTLFIKLENKESLVTSRWKVSADFPAGFWPALERRLSPTAAERVNNTLLLRLHALRRRGEVSALVPKALGAKGSAWGYELRQKDAYDIVLTHYRIKRSGAPAAAVEHQYRLANPAEEVLASRRYIGLLGNYRADALWVSPLIVGAGPIEIAVEPRRLKAPEEMVDPTTDKVVGLRVPILVKPKKWDKKRYVNLGLTVLGALASLYLLSRYLDSTTTDDGRKLLLGLIAILVSLSLNALKDLLLPEK